MSEKEIKPIMKNFKISVSLDTAIRQRASELGTGQSDYIRELIERDLETANDETSVSDAAVSDGRN